MYRNARVRKPPRLGWTAPNSSVTSTSTSCHVDLGPVNASCWTASADRRASLGLPPMMVIAPPANTSAGCVPKSAVDTMSASRRASCPFVELSHAARLADAGARSGWLSSGKVGTCTTPGNDAAWHSLDQLPANSPSTYNPPPPVDDTVTSTCIQGNSAVAPDPTAGGGYEALAVRTQGDGAKAGLYSRIPELKSTATSASAVSLMPRRARPWTTTVYGTEPTRTTRSQTSIDHAVAVNRPPNTVRARST